MKTCLGIIVSNIRVSLLPALGGGGAWVSSEGVTGGLAGTGVLGSTQRPEPGAVCPQDHPAPPARIRPEKHCHRGASHRQGLGTQRYDAFLHS